MEWWNRRPNGTTTTERDMRDVIRLEGSTNILCPCNRTCLCLSTTRNHEGKFRVRAKSYFAATDWTISHLFLSTRGILCPVRKTKHEKIERGTWERLRKAIPTQFHVPRQPHKETLPRTFPFPCQTKPKEVCARERARVWVWEAKGVKDALAASDHLFLRRTFPFPLGTEM